MAKNTIKVDKKQLCNVVVESVKKTLKESMGAFKPITSPLFAYKVVDEPTAELIKREGFARYSSVDSSRLVFGPGIYFVSDKNEALNFADHYNNVLIIVEIEPQARCLFQQYGANYIIVNPADADKIKLKKVEKANDPNELFRIKLEIHDILKEKGYSYEDRDKILYDYCKQYVALYEKVHSKK